MSACPCEVCKTEKKNRRQARAVRKAIRQVEQQRDAEALALGRKVQGALEKLDVWTSWPAQGGPIYLHRMSRSHLHYAIAKAERGEYHGSWGEKVRALKLAALQRLVQELAP